MANEKRILIVEDEENWQDIFDSLLESEGYVNEIATSYGEAVGELRRKPYDLVVIDLRLSPVDEENRAGMGLLGHAFDRGVPAIVVTGYGTPALADKAYKEYGVFYFLDKASFDSTKFVELVREAIATKEARRAGEELTPEQKRKFEELTRRLFRDEAIHFE